MGTEGGRKIWSMGEALKSKGAKAEAVVQGVETNVVSAKSADEGRIDRGGLFEYERRSGRDTG